MQVAITTISMQSLIAITSCVVRAENNVRSLPDRLLSGGVVRSQYETINILGISNNYNSNNLAVSECYASKNSCLFF